MTFDPTELASAGITMICLRCRKAILSPQKYANYHDACITCPDCGSDLEIHVNKFKPTEVRCWECIHLHEREEQERLEREACQRAEAAREHLLSGVGDRASREEAIRVLEEIAYDSAC